MVMIIQILKVVIYVVRPWAPVVRHPVLRHEPTIRAYVVVPAVLGGVLVTPAGEPPESICFVPLRKKLGGEGRVKSFDVAAACHPEIATEVAPRGTTRLPAFVPSVTPPLPAEHLAATSRANCTRWCVGSIRNRNVLSQLVNARLHALHLSSLKHPEQEPSRYSPIFLLCLSSVFVWK